MTTIPNAPDGELIVPDGTEKIPLAKGTLDKFIQALNLVVGRLRETTGPTVLTLGSILDGEFLQRSGTNIVGGTINAVPYKNIIINGAIQVSQRSPATAVPNISTPGYYVVDRFRFAPIALGTWTMSEENDAPAGSGLRKSLKLLVTTADAAPAAGDSAIFQYRMEGQHIQHIRKGTASAKQVTKSFWVKSSTTGTYILELFDSNNTRQVSASFSISLANTWELKTITMPADTSGVLNNDNNLSLSAHIWLAAGSNFTSGTLNTVWAASVDANRAVGQVNLASAINNYIQFAGLQLEVNPTATSFEFVPIEVDLFRCKRYYQKSFPYATVPAQNAGIVGAMRFLAGKAGAGVEVGSFPFPVQMRATPTLATYNPSAANAQVRDSTATADCSGTGTGGNTSDSVVSVFATGNAGTSVGNILEVQWAAEVEL